MSRDNVRRSPDGRAVIADYLIACDVCACPAQLRSYFDEDGRRLRYCNFHEDHGTDLPCPDCAAAAEAVA